MKLETLKTLYVVICSAKFGFLEFHLYSLSPASRVPMAFQRPSSLKSNRWSCSELADQNARLMSAKSEDPEQALALAAQIQVHITDDQLRWVEHVLTPNQNGLVG